MTARSFALFLLQGTVTKCHPMAFMTLCPILYCQNNRSPLSFLKHLAHRKKMVQLLSQTSLFSSKLLSSCLIFILVSLLLIPWFVMYLLRGGAQPAVDPADLRFLKQAAEQNSCFGGPASDTSANTSQTKLFRFFFSCTCPYTESQVMCTWYLGLRSPSWVLNIT